MTNGKKAQNRVRYLVSLLRLLLQGGLGGLAPLHLVVLDVLAAAAVGLLLFGAASLGVLERRVERVCVIGCQSLEHIINRTLESSWPAMTKFMKAC